MNFSNLGNDMFRESLDSAIYADKTGLIGYANSVSRQDRNMSSYRVREDSANPWPFLPHVRFSSHVRQSGGGEIDTYEKHINKYNVVDFINNTLDTKTGLAKIQRTLISDLKHKDDSDASLMINDMFSEQR